MSLPPPNELGAPARFSSWRDGQDDLLTRLMVAPTRFKVVDAPVGVGKSVVNFTFASAQGGRLLYLTGRDLTLQDQVSREMAPAGLFDVRGMSNYPCLALPNKAWNTCEKGPCLEGAHCEWRNKGCHYYDAVREARAAKYTATNFAMHLSMSRNDDQLGARDVLVVDEAHEAAEVLSEFMKVDLDADVVNSKLWPVKSAPTDMTLWKTWAMIEAGVVATEMVGLDAADPERRKLSKLLVGLKRVMNIEPSERWVWQFTEKGVSLEPIWPAPYAEKYLFRGIGSVLLSSATLRPYSLKYLGLKPEDYTFVSALSPFPRSRRPIYWLKTGVKLKWGMDELSRERWIHGIDSILADRGHWRGIIHATSYDRARSIVQASQYRSRMLLAERGNARDIVLRFKTSRPGTILVSPSVTTGHDFPYDAARFQIVAKMPFAPIDQNPVMAIRAAEDKQYADGLVVTALQQTAGRVMRATDDMGETWIVDDHAGWFHSRHREMFAGWYNEAYQVVTTPPKPLEVK